MPERSHEKCSSCNSCHFKCHKKISVSNRRLLHENFWKMTDDAKFAYYVIIRQRVDFLRSVAE